MKRPLYLLLAMTVALATATCGHRTTTPTNEPPTNESAPQKSYVFMPPVAPAQLPVEEKTEWLRQHYWDKFDFADTLWVTHADTSMMIRAFASYAVLLSEHPTDGAPVDSLMRRASTSRKMQEYFAWLGEEVLHDPNSPFRNDEFYIPILRAVLQSPWYDEYERIAPQYDLKIALQNRLGAAANDFRYTLASGATGRLYSIRTEYVLLFINNPGCPMCREIRKEIVESPMLTEMVEQGRLTILALYPDQDLDEWEKYRSEIPGTWINAYDKGCHLNEENLYDLRAIPSLYLLDRDKRVLAKDVTSVALIEELIDRGA